MVVPVSPKLSTMGEAEIDHLRVPATFNVQRYGSRAKLTSTSELQ